MSPRRTQQQPRCKPPAPAAAQAVAHDAKAAALGGHPLVLPIAAARDFGLIELRSASELIAEVLPTGALFALRHGPTLINQFLPGPAEDGLFRLLVRWSDSAELDPELDVETRGRGDAEKGQSPRLRVPASPRLPDRKGGWSPLVGPGLAFRRISPTAAGWSVTAGGLRCETTLSLHPQLAAWTWRVRVRNVSGELRRVDLLHAQDLGLADPGAVHNNEAYVCQYLDLLPVEDAQLGWVILARQNQAMAESKHPWLAVACTTGAAAFCTDGWQFFGADHRLTGEPAAVRMPALPSRREQYEFSVAGLQSRAIALEPGAETEVAFVARFVANHPAISFADDVALLREVCPPEWSAAPPSVEDSRAIEASPARNAPLFVSAAWMHGDRPSAADWDAWFPGARRHLEHGPDGSVWSFFHGAETHVVARDKEAIVDRPHGHILRNGDGRWIDDTQFGLTCYAAGIFSAQAYFGNSSFGRLLPVVRNALGLGRAAGQRVFVRVDGAWRQLGVPSAFAMDPGSVRWIYRCGARTIEARVWCSHGRAASFLELRVSAGGAVEFLISHALALGSVEFEQGGRLELYSKAGWMGCHPAPGSMLARHMHGVCFGIAATDAAAVAELNGAAPLAIDLGARHAPYATIRSAAVDWFGVIMLAVNGGAAELPVAIAAAREEFAAKSAPAHPPLAPVRLRAAGDPGVARIDEALPWFTHNASIHFSAPHGLEQYSGAAWGVRDVCQGSLEWLLAAGEHATARRMIETVFAQQYVDDGGWPQWFMHPPFRYIQQPHSHGDVCFWPVKALCDYVEAANDFAFLRRRARYMEAARFEPCGENETLLEHCDRVVTLCESRFVPGTALVNYGDGDWDDTLQPADPAMRTRMVSAWTVAFAFQTFRQLAVVCRRAGEKARAERLDGLTARMRADFAARLMPDGVVAGFRVAENGGERFLLHPRDAVTGIRYRLLPMTRAILADLFTGEEARRHIAIVQRELLYPDGVRLMSAPAQYHGGRERLFKRADTAANVGREIGLQYVHAHLRYAEALSRLGDADGLWRALQVINPVGLREVLAHAEPRQSNVYFSSSDAAFADRVEAAARWDELRSGNVPVRGGWRLYSSGPGIFIRIMRACLLGVRESFGEVVFDPVLPETLDGLVAEMTLGGRTARLHYRVTGEARGAQAVSINGTRIDAAVRETNPYRTGGLRVPRSAIDALFTDGENSIEITS